MQKVVGSNPISRFLRKPRSGGVFVCPGWRSRRQTGAMERKWKDFRAVGPRTSLIRPMDFSLNTIYKAPADQGSTWSDEIGGAARSQLTTTEADRKDRTMKLTTTTQVSVDGVMQGPGGADEDRSGGFERGGWAMLLFDNEARAYLVGVYERADAFLFGRKTYDIFAGYWGVMDPSENAFAEALNTKPKYVASSTLTEPKWDDTTVLSDDVAAAVGELKAKPGGELQVHGSGALIRWLMDHDLVDEINLVTCPVVVGQGTRLFPDTGPDRALTNRDLRSQTTPGGGLIIRVYRLAGRPEYATAG